MTQPNRYVIKTWDRFSNRDGVHHMEAFTAADAVFQLDLQLGRSTPRREAIESVRPYDETRDGAWLVER